MKSKLLLLLAMSLFVVVPVFGANETQGQRYYYDECGEYVGEDWWFCGTAGVNHYGDYSDIYTEFIEYSCDFQPFSCDSHGLVDLCGTCVSEGYALGVRIGSGVEDPCG